MKHSKTYSKDAGKVITRERERIGLNQSQLAQAIKDNYKAAKKKSPRTWNGSVVSKLESGVQQLSTEAINDIAIGLGMSRLTLVMMCLKAEYPEMAGGELEAAVEAVR